jgi:hypothetical protein
MISEFLTEIPDIHNNTRKMKIHINEHREMIHLQFYLTCELIVLAPSAPFLDIHTGKKRIDPFTR